MGRGARIGPFRRDRRGGARRGRCLGAQELRRADETLWLDRAKNPGLPPLDRAAVLEKAFAAEPMEHWAKAFDAHDVFYAPIQTPAEVVDDLQARATGAWIQVEGAEVDGRPVETVDAPIRWDGQSRVSTPAPPRSGQHNKEILSWLGYPEGEIDRLSTPPA